MNHEEILEMFEHLRDEQTAAIDKAIRMCIKMHSRNGQISIATENNSMSLDLSNQQGSSVLNDNNFHSTSEDGPSTSKSSQSFDHVSTADVAEFSSGAKKREAAKLSVQSTPNAIEPMFNTQKRMSTSVEFQVSSRASSSRYDSPISYRTLEMQISTPHSTPKRHNSEMNNLSTMDVVHCNNLSADTNNDNLSEFSPRINLAPANNSSLNLSEVASMMSRYENGLDRLKTLDTNRATGPGNFTGNSSHAEKNVFDKFLAESTPMALRPVIRTQRILSEGTIMQSPSASIDASTLGSPRPNQFNRTQLISDQIEQQSVDGENNFLLEENSNKNAEKRQTEDWNEDDDTDTENYNKKRLGKKINSTIRIPERFVCDAENCVSVFTTRTSLNEHKRTHKDRKPYKCNACNKSFRWSSHLSTHMRIHSGEKPYNCLVCNKSFSLSSNLSAHMRIHSGEKPYNCLVCNKSFSLSSNFSTHMRIHSGEKPYNCLVCNKSFSLSSYLSTHMRTHSGEKPYNCLVCNKSFSLSSNLSRHIRIHNGEKPYNCLVCNKSFSLSINLSTHMRIHNDNNQPNSTKERFSCDYCGKVYFGKRYIELHCFLCYKNPKC